MANKIDILKKKLYFTKFNILWNKAIKEGKIKQFDDEIFQQMSNTIIACFPVSFYIKHSNHMFAQDTYYALYGCSNVSKIDKKTYLEQHKEFVDKHVSHDFDEFRPGGKRRLDLGILIIQIRALSQMLGDEQFTKDFNDYLTLIEYDEKQISEEREKTIQRILTDKSAMTVISGNRR